MPSIQDLNQQFALGDSLKFAEHSSGLLMGILQTDLCSAQFFLQGAHVSHFHPSHAAKPILFMSEAALFEPNRPIRGGIPICFPGSAITPQILRSQLTAGYEPPLGKFTQQNKLQSTQKLS